MKFVFDCEDEVLLPFTYDFAEEAEAYLKKTRLLDVRKKREDGVEVKDQAKKNIKEMFKIACKDHPEETAELLRRLWIVGEGEKAPNLARTVVKVLLNKDALDFFALLMELAQ